jgi:hypothetical protein
MHAPTNVLAELGSQSTLSSEGHAQWPGFVYQKVEPVLRAAVVVVGPDDRELNDTDAWAIASKTIIACVKKAPNQPINPLKLLEEADRVASEHFRQSETDYILVGSLSIDSLPAKTIRIGGCTISSLAERGTQFPLPAVLSSRSLDGPLLDHIKSSRYQLLRVVTKGRTIHSAVEHALYALNLLRGLWSLFATWRTWSISVGSTSRNPIGVIHTGPVFTLHSLDGKPINEFYWYFPDHIKDRPLFKGKGKWPVVEKMRKSAMKRLAKLSYRADMESILVRYAGSLDHQNPDLAFLEMWSILEKLTGTIGGNYDETIDRGIWLYKSSDRPIIRDNLRSLRLRRNQFVHSGKSATDSDQVAFLIKDIIDPHLVALLFNHLKVQSFEEYASILALPTDQSVLGSKKDMIVKAIRYFRSPGSK